MQVEFFLLLLLIVCVVELDSSHNKKLNVLYTQCCTNVRYLRFLMTLVYAYAEVVME